MDNGITQYLSTRGDRKNILSQLHSTIIQEDKSITPAVEKMMGKEMIVYNAKGLMKYALSSMKNYMSLHVLPIYGSKILFDKYRALLPKTTFQKGCINFKDEKEMPLEIVKQLIADCSAIDLAAIREKYAAKRKLKARNK